MRYLLVGDDTKTLFVEDEKQTFAIYYVAKNNMWYDGTYILWKNRVGFDPSEPVDSMYRYGNLSCMEEIVEITHEQAKEFLSQKFTDEQMAKLFNQIKKMANRPVY